MRRKGVLKGHRLQLDLSDAQHDRIKRLTSKTDASSFAWVIRTALGLYEQILDAHREGRRLAFLKDGEPPLEILIPTVL